MLHGHQNQLVDDGARSWTSRCARLAARFAHARLLGSLFGTGLGALPGESDTDTSLSLFKGNIFATVHRGIVGTLDATDPSPSDGRVRQKPPTCASRTSRPALKLEHSNLFVLLF